MPLDLEKIRADAGKLDLEKIRVDAASLAEPPATVSATGLTNEPLLPGALRPEVATQPGLAPQLPLNVTTSNWLMPDIEVRTPTIEQQVKDAFGLAAQTGMSVPQAQDVIQTREQQKRVNDKIQKGPTGFWEGAAQDWATKVPFSPVGALEMTDVVLAMGRLRDNKYDAPPLFGSYIIPTVQPAWGQMTPQVGWQSDLQKQRDQKVVDDYVAKMTERAERGYTFGGKVGAGISILPSYMIEFAATGGLRTLASEATKRALEKRIKSEMAKRTAAWVTGAALQATGMPNRVAESILARRLGEDPENWGTSIAKGYGDTFVEVASEVTGEAITRGLATAFRKVPFGSKLVDALHDTWVSLKPTNTTAKFLDSMLSKAKYDGIIGEIGEERVGTIMRNLLKIAGPPEGYTKEQWEKTGLYDRAVAVLEADIKQMPVEAVVLSIPGVGRFAVGTLVGKVEEHEAMKPRQEGEWQVYPQQTEGQAEEFAQQMLEAAQKRKEQNVQIVREGKIVRMRKLTGEALVEAKERQLYNDLMEKAEAGDEAAWDQLNELNQRMNLPDYEELLDKALAGDQEAREAIQKGQYRATPVRPGIQATVEVKGQEVPRRMPETGKPVPAPAESAPSKAAPVSMPQVTAGPVPGTRRPVMQEPSFDFLVRHTNQAAQVQSILDGDTTQIANDVQNGRVDAAAIERITEEALAEQLISQETADQIRQILPEGAKPVPVTEAVPPKEVLTTETRKSWELTPDEYYWPKGKPQPQESPAEQAKKQEYADSQPDHEKVLELAVRRGDDVPLAPIQEYVDGGPNAAAWQLYREKADTPDITWVLARIRRNPVLADYWDKVVEREAPRRPDELMEWFAMRMEIESGATLGNEEDLEPYRDQPWAAKALRALAEHDKYIYSWEGWKDYWKQQGHADFSPDPVTIHEYLLDQDIDYKEADADLWMLEVKPEPTLAGGAEHPTRDAAEALMRKKEQRLLDALKTGAEVVREPSQPVPTVGAAATEAPEVVPPSGVAAVPVTEEPAEITPEQRQQYAQDNDLDIEEVTDEMVRAELVKKQPPSTEVATATKETAEPVIEEEPQPLPPPVPGETASQRARRELETTGKTTIDGKEYGIKFTSKGYIYQTPTDVPDLVYTKGGDPRGGGWDRDEAIENLVTREIESELRRLEVEKNENPQVTTEADVTLANRVADALKNGGEITPEQFWRMADESYGGTRAQGTYGPSEAYDALELGINKYLREAKLDPSIDLEQAQLRVSYLESLLDSIPTQKSRSGEKDLYQQFSTPPHYAYAVAWVANIDKNDVVLEPSAGTGGLAVFAKNTGARVIANELSDRRAKLLEALGLDRVTREDAEQIHNILDEIPSVVIMNPPFSHAAQRMGAKKIPGTDRNHIDAALKLLQDRGRLVAVMGRPLVEEKGESVGFEKWLDGIKKQYNVRANVYVGRDVYKKYGTTFPTRVLVIDKTGPTKGEIQGGTVDSIADLMYNLQGVRNDRTRPEQIGTQPAVPQGPTGLGGAGPLRVPGQPPTGGVGAGEPETGGSLGAPSVRPPGAGGGTVELEGGGPGNAPGGRRGELPGANQPGVAGARPGGEPVREPEPEAPGPPVIGPGWGDKNKLFTKEKADAARAKLASLKGKLPGGKQAGAVDISALDPEIWKALLDLGGFHVEAGLRNFADWSRQMIADMGEEIQSYLPNIWAAVGPKLIAVGQRVSMLTDRKALGDNIYEPYFPAQLNIPNMKQHPGSVVESAPMAAVSLPPVKYDLNLPKEVIEKGQLSNVQLEVVVYAGAAHSQILSVPSQNVIAKRRGFLVGDGTGLGKGRENAGIILDNMRHGRKKAIWISKNNKLFNDAVRDWTGISQNAKKLIPFKKALKEDKLVGDEGVLYVTYGMLRSETRPPRGSQQPPIARVQQLIDWCGPDFDGVIIFDEAHAMSNMGGSSGRRAQRASETALAGQVLRDALPNARIVYCTATAATEVSNFAYMDRLGLWGQGTAFANRAQFIGEISSGGVNAMEILARDIKAMGMGLSRSLSFNDGTPEGTVEQERVEYNLTPEDTARYNTLAEGWQVAWRGMREALEITGGDHSKDARKRVNQRFWTDEQRFFNQVITAMQTPVVINDIQQQLDAGKSCVVQLTNTLAAAEDREWAKRAEDEDLEDFDVSPREILMNLVENYFPIYQYELQDDGHGNTVAVLALDSQGNPIVNREALQKRDELLNRIGSLDCGESPLTLILNHFGIDEVAEVTGRTQRFVRVEGKMTRLDRSANENQIEIDRFQSGKKHILIFSEAGGTGASYHADRATENQQRRVHYLLQPGWRAITAIQGLGRTHRSNQAWAPLYKLVTTNLKAQKRFISTIARRLAQLGALSKGERKVGTAGLFTASDNLESAEATAALRTFFVNLVGGEIEGLTADQFEEQSGLRIRNPNGSLKNQTPEMNQFLNRLLGFTIEQQNQTFDAFEQILESAVEAARANGTLDTGVENYQAENITKTSEQVAYTHPATGAQTKYVRLRVDNKVQPISWESAESRNPVMYVRNTQNGNLYAAVELHARTDATTGRIIPQYRLVSQSDSHAIDKSHIDDSLYHKDNKWVEVDRMKARDEWQKALDKMPPVKSKEEHFITGLILPIWDRLRGQARVYRVLTDKGEVFVGRVVPPRKIGTVLRNLGITAQTEHMAPAQAVNQVESGDIQVELVNGWRVKRAFVQGENRIELTGPDYLNETALASMGIFRERPEYKTRYFIPTGEDAVDVYSRLVAQWPVSEVIQMTAAGGQPPTGRGMRPGFLGFGAPAGMAGPNVTARISNAEKNILKDMGFTLTEILGMSPGKAREMIRLRNTKGFRPGFLRFRRGDSLQKKIDQAIADMERMLGSEVVAEAKAEPAPTEPVAPNDANGLLAKLKSALDNAKDIAPSVEEEQEETLSQEVGKAVGIKTTYLKKGVRAKEALGRSTSALQGPQAQYDQLYESIRDDLGKETIEAIENRIATDPNLKYFEGLELVGTDQKPGLFDKLIDGSALTLREAEVLERYFGLEVGKIARKRVPWSTRAWQEMLAVANIPRTLMASLDQSGILRQARRLGQEYPVEWVKMFTNYQRTFFSEGAAQELQKKLQDSPYYKDAKKAGLQLLSFGNINTPVEELEERYMAARLLEWIPGIRASERSFVVSLNALRLAVYEKVLHGIQGDKQEISPGSKIFRYSKRKMSASEKKHLASQINNLSGRTAIPEFLKEFAPVLNAVFFSPRFTLSRLADIWSLPGGVYRSVAEGRFRPELKMELVSAASMIVTNLLLQALVSAIDDDWEMETDIGSADFGKMKHRNFRIEPWAGYVQSVRLIGQLITLHRKTVAGEEYSVTKKDLLKQFVRSKESPIASLVTDWLVGETMTGRPFGAVPVGKEGEFLSEIGIPKEYQGAALEVWNRIAPLTAQDTADALAVEGYPHALIAMGLGFFGAGVQTYEPSEYQQVKILKNEVAKSEYHKTWDELTPKQQKALRGSNPEIGEAELRAKATAYPLQTIENQEAVQSSKQILKAVPAEVRQALTKVGISAGVSKRLGDFHLSNQRHAFYKDLAAKAIEKHVSQQIQTPKYQNAPLTQRAELLQKEVNDAREEARKELLMLIEGGEK